MIDAIKRADEPLVRELVNLEAPVNEPDANGVLPLCHASLLKTESIAIFLLQNRADSTHVKPHHYTALTWAIRNNPPQVEWLLQHGARPN